MAGKSRKTAAAAAAPEEKSMLAEAPAPEAIPRSTIISRVPRTHAQPNQRDPKKLSPAERKLAGQYRVIHGTLKVPLTPDKFRLADGSENPLAPKWEDAIPGDVVYLNDNDAAAALDAGVVEELDAKPSRVGQVFSPPKVVKHFGLPSGAGNIVGDTGGLPHIG